MNNITFPNQRVSFAKKQTSEWYKPTIDYIINKALQVNAKLKQELNSNINASNAILDDSEIDYVLKPYGLTDKNNIIPTLRNVSLILPIKRRYIGEYIRQFKKFQVYHKDTQAVLSRNTALEQSLLEIMMKKIVNKTIEQGAATGQQQETPEDLDKYKEDFTDNWIDDKVIESQHILDYIKELTNSEVEYIKAFNYWWATEEVYSYRKIHNNELIKKIIDPREYYRIPTDNLFVEDDDMGMRKYAMSLNDINEYLGDYLTKSDITYIEELQTLLSDSNIDVNFLTSRIIGAYNKRGDNQLDNLSVAEFSVNDLSRFCTVYHVVFKSYTKIGYLKYINELNIQTETIVDETYKLDIEAGDLSIEWDWILEVFEAERIGDEHTGIYTKPRKIVPQRQDINILSNCKLPYNGISGTFNNVIRNPICKLLKPYEALYRIFTYQKERAIAKYRSGLTIIPESLIQDSDSLSTEQKMAYAKRDDTLYVNDADVEANSAQLLRFVGNSGGERYIEILSKVINDIKNEAMEIADMNAQRMGDINQGAGKATTEQAISRASTGSILLFTLFNKCVEKDFEADIDYAKVAWINGKQGSYFDKEQNKMVYVDINGEDFNNRNIGIFVGNTSINEEKLAQYRSFAMSAAQNGDFDIAADAIESENSTELHKIIKNAMDKKRALEQQMNEQNNQTQLQVSKETIANADAQRNHEKEHWQIQYSQAIDVAKINSGAVIDAKILDVDNKTQMNNSKLESQKEQPK